MTRQDEEAALRKQYDAMGAGLYEATARDVQRYGSRVKDFLASALGPRGSVLDVGCGPGQLTRDLPELVDVVGLDLSPDMVELAGVLRPRGIYRVHSYYDPIHSALGRFDAVLAVGCLDFCSDLPLVFRNLSSSMREGGRALLTLCELRPELPGHELARHEVKVRDRTLTVYFYPFLETAQALVNAGFRVRRYEHAPGWVDKHHRLTMHWGWWEVERASTSVR